VEELMRRWLIGCGAVVACAGIAAAATAFSGDAAPDPKPRDPVSRRPVAEPPAPPPSGLVELPSPFPASRFLLDPIGWQDVGAADRVTAYAGSLGTDHEQGVVVVVRASLPKRHDVPDLERETDPDDRYEYRSYATPAKAGPVRISAARGYRLTLRAADGTELVFDVAARRYAR
jgi:hypothetical protein